MGPKYVLVLTVFSVFCPRMPTHPCSFHEGHLAQTHWVENEFKTLDLGDPRRVRRLKLIVADLLAQPGASIPKASGHWAGSKAADRFFDNAAVDPAALRVP